MSAQHRFTNREIADLLAGVAARLQILDANRFRVIAYQNAAENIRNLAQDVNSVAAEGKLEQIPGVGKGIADALHGLLVEGHYAEFDTLLAEVPQGVVEMMDVPDMGPKKAKRLWQELGIDSVDALQAAAAAGQLRDLKGFGAKSEEKILRAIAAYRPGAARTRLDVGFTYAESIVGRLQGVPGVKQLVPAGSLRRRRETIGDLDILAISSDGGPLMEAFAGYDGAEAVISRGPTKSSLRLRGGLQVDLRVLEEKSFGAALLYFTGSKDHNIALRRRAQERGLKVSEYGIFRAGEEGKPLAGKTEEECYRLLGLDWIPPELRENRGEIEAAAAGKLPDLIELADVRGDLHAHTTATDGKNSIAEMAAGAQAQGYEYLALTDHTRAVRVAGALAAAEMSRHLRAIEKARDGAKGIALLKGAEVDILADGRLDLPDAVLDECDVVVASVHSRFSLPEKEMTKRIVSALKNPRVNILAHPTGRLLLEREPYAVDIEEVIRAAAGEGVILEINAHPSRLDLNDVHARMARAAGAKIVISTDAHSVAQFPLMSYGVFTARRGWLAKGDVVNTYPLAKLRGFLKR